jgi:hypothetical protein
MEGGIHEDEVEVRLAAAGPADIGMPEEGPGIAHIPARAGNGAAINVPQLQVRHPGALQGAEGEDAKTTPEVGAATFKGRKDF